MRGRGRGGAYFGGGYGGTEQDTVPEPARYTPELGAPSAEYGEHECLVHRTPPRGEFQQTSTEFWFLDKVFD